MSADYKTALPKLEELKGKYPEEFSRLDRLTSPKELEAFGAEAREHANNEAWRQVARYAAIREMQSRVPSGAEGWNGQYVEDCVAERVWVAFLRIGKIDPVTQRLIERHGFLGAMIEQLKPMSRVGVGNFLTLHKAGLVDCTAEYCVWNWGYGLVEKDLQSRLDALAKQFDFKKL